MPANPRSRRKTVAEPVEEALRAEPVEVEALRVELASAHRRVGVLEAEIARRDGEAAEQAARPKPIARVLTVASTRDVRFAARGELARWMAALRAHGAPYLTDGRHPTARARAAMVGYVLSAAERAYDELIAEFAAADEAARVQP